MSRTARPSHPSVLISSGSQVCQMSYGPEVGARRVLVSHTVDDRHIPIVVHALQRPHVRVETDLGVQRENVPSCAMASLVRLS